MTVLGELMGRRGIRSADLGRYLGVGPSTAGRYTRGERSLPASDIPRVAALLGVSVESIESCEITPREVPAYLAEERSEPWEQLPLKLTWRLVCVACGRDRWLSLTAADAARLRPGRCPTCAGMVIVEPDGGMRAGRDVVA